MTVAVGAAWDTVTVTLPVAEVVAVSATVTVWLPAVRRTTPLKVCVPASPAVKV